MTNQGALSPWSGAADGSSHWYWWEVKCSGNRFPTLEVLDEPLGRTTVQELVKEMKPLHAVDKSRHSSKLSAFLPHRFLEEQIKLKLHFSSMPQYPPSPCTLIHEAPTHQSPTSECPQCPHLKTAHIPRRT